MSKYIVVNGIRIARDFEPETFGRLTAIGPRFTVSNGLGGRYVYQVCQCECGNIIVKNKSGLVSSNTRSCGCLATDKSRERQIRHGDYGSVEYRTWASLKDRCCNAKNAVYSIYGGRGIKVCDRWLEPDGRGYMNFLEDMGRRPSTKHSIDRIDVNGDYCPENCRWATKKQQARNRTNSKIITAFNKTQTLAEWAEEYNIPAATLTSRINRGLTLEQAIAHPKGTKYPKAVKNDVPKPTKQ